MFQAPIALDLPFVLTVSVSMLKEKKRSSDPRSFAESSKKQHWSSTESKEVNSNLSETRKQYCYLETAGQMKEADSYLGFKSVFSFL